MPQIFPDFPYKEHGEVPVKYKRSYRNIKVRSYRGVRKPKSFWQSWSEEPLPKIWIWYAVCFTLGGIFSDGVIGIFKLIFNK